MNARTVLEQRIKTLVGLLDTPDGPLGPNAGEIGEQLRSGWDTERRLLERILAETKGDDAMATICAWRDRTAAYVEKSEDEPPQWTDREGFTWNARQVLSLLDDTQGRVERWIRAAQAVNTEGQGDG